MPLTTTPAKQEVMDLVGVVCHLGTVVCVWRGQPIKHSSLVSSIARGGVSFCCVWVSLHFPLEERIYL